MCVCHGIINSSCTGAQQVKSLASKTNDVAGDGTTTATVLASAIYSEGCKAVAAGMNPLDLRRGIQLAVNKVTDVLTVRNVLLRYATCIRFVYNVVMCNI